MNILTKLLPVAALGVVGIMNSDILKDNLSIVHRAKMAATAGIEMRALADAVAMEYSNNSRLPILNFSHFLATSMEEKGGGQTRDPSQDLWATPYRITVDVKANGFTVWSAGPDKTWTNKDDLKYFYSLSGIGGENAISSREQREWESLNAYYQRQNSLQASNKSGDDGLSAPQPEEEEMPIQADVERLRKTFESQMKRAERGSARAKLDLAERYMNGDGFVKKDLAQAKKYLDETMGNLDFQTDRDKASKLLEEVKAQLGN